MIEQNREINRFHNDPPDDDKIMHMDLAERHDDVLALYESTISKADQLPNVVTNDDEQKKISDYILKITGCRKTLDATRAAEKEPHLRKGRAIDGFFKSRIEKLDELKARISEPAARYAKEKEDRKRREAEEKARLEREEAERVRREAEEKARLAREAELKAIREKEEAERKANEERIAAERAKEEARLKAEAEARAIREKAQRDAEAAQAEIDRLNKEAQEKAALNAAALKEAQDRAEMAEKAIKLAEKEVKVIEKEAEKTVKSLDKEVRANEREAEEKARLAALDAKAQNREANAALDAANRQDRYANKAEKQTLVKGAILSRTRGEGSISSVTETWIGSVISREELDLEALRDHIPMDALDKAVNSFVRAGGRELRGAIITEETKFAVRG